MKEMVGGCCVCSDERGWAENPLVYCDGVGCNVAVHQACYGIVTVPTGPWYCRKCESQERSVRVRCELCPSRDGALKKTDNSGWAHVVCALYIPEVRFGNVTTMEPIILQLIPTERFSKVCYICEEQGRGSKATMGACMQCNKSGCKQQFHVTCAQALGLLCEEAGNYLDNVKYCGYCQHHYSKLKKGGNVKTIPPYKPIPTNDNGSSDSSPEKESVDSLLKAGMSGKRKSTGKAPTGVTIKVTTGSVGDAPGSEVADLSPVQGVPLGPSSGGGGNTKFTTSNFVETVVTQSESVFGADVPMPLPGVMAPASSISGKKRKAGGSRTPTSADNSSDVTTFQPPVSVVSGSVNVPVTTSSIPAPTSMMLVSAENHSDTKKMKVEVGESVVVSNNMPGNVITSAPSSAPVTSGSIVVSVPLTATTIQPPPTPSTTTVVTSAPTLFQQLQQSIVATAESRAQAQPVQPQPPQPVPVQPQPMPQQSEDQPGKRVRTQSTEKNEKGRKQKSRATTASNSNSNNSNSKRSIRTPPPIKESPPSSPGSETTSVHSAGRNSTKSRSSKRPSSSRDRDEKDIKPCSGIRGKAQSDTDRLWGIFQNGVTAPHMLGNQLNPSSTMAQKMSDTLSAELEAHSVFTESSNTQTTLVGPQLHSRVIASVRNANASGSGAGSSGQGNASTSNTTAANNTSTSGAAVGTIPHSLDQLLERQWEQGSQFLMEQAQHFDIASLLSCLHQLRAENLRLEEHVNSLLQRRDHLLAVNARLAIPLTTQPSAPVNNVHPGTGSNVGHPHSDPSRNTRINNTYVTPLPLENGLPPDPSPPAGYPHPHQHRSPAAQPSPTIRQSPAGSGYMLSQSPLNPVPGSTIVTPASSTPGVVRSTSATPDPLRGTDTRRTSQPPPQSGYSMYQVVSSPATVSSHQNSQVPVVTSQQMVMRRDAVTDLHHQMPTTKPS